MTAPGPADAAWQPRYGVFSRRGELPRVGAAVGTQVLDLAGLAAEEAVGDRRWFAAGSLNAFLRAGRPAWTSVRDRLAGLLAAGAAPGLSRHLSPIGEVELHPPVATGDVVEFSSAPAHAEAVAELLGADGSPLPPSAAGMPFALPRRAGAVRTSAAPVERPSGQFRAEGAEGAAFGPTTKLDVAVKLAAVVGVPTPADRLVTAADYADHVFGLTLVADFCARDFQTWAFGPLGALLGDAFRTVVSPWVTPTHALAGPVPAAEEAPGSRTPLPYLLAPEPAPAIDLELELNGQVVSRPRTAALAWTPAQLFAQAASGGHRLRTGDLISTGTISGPARTERGCLLELTDDGARPLELVDGSTRGYLADGDSVRVHAFGRGPQGERVPLGEVAVTIHPAPL
ncbi:fumarylacetoacetate hydrolase family protein [Allonocardiopsis opalescens]|uniref:fumarylacetoacetase n=1 Tax=Allonocardiopsis opalescens TaxID=1144618 RepID=A0A2T0QA80_9ACTN|nr:fumarylacetoacetate hydrolase family protein [Allonocardiopsis opalescens]PRY00725.1 fumarylacetoacetase [Allonocardiopsis opalescens]